MKRLLFQFLISGIAFATLPHASERFGSAVNSPSAGHSQEASTQEQRQQSEEKYGDIVLAPDQVVVRRYVPQVLEAKELYRILKDLRGRSIFNVNGSRGYQNITTLGDAILIRDQAEMVNEIQALAVRLDTSLGTRDEVDLRLLEFSPRFLSVKSARMALSPFARMVRDPHTHAEVGNMTDVGERNVIILRDTPEQVTQMLALLTRIDVPDPQVRIRTWVAIGDPKSTEMGGLPADLVPDLAELLPGFGFRSDGLAIIQTSVAIGRGVELEIEGAQQDYSLMMRPTAYDRESGRLTLGSIQFGSRPSPNAGGTRQVRPHGDPVKVLFTTSAVLNVGDYTVLGASGRMPIFLIVKVEPLENGTAGAR